MARTRSGAQLHIVANRSLWVIPVAVFALFTGVLGLPVAAPVTAAPALLQTTMRVLVVSNGNTTPIEDMLTAQGVPFTKLTVSQANSSFGTDDVATNAAYLATTGAARVAQFQGVVLPNASGGGINVAAQTALNTYLTTYGIRQVSAYDYPSSLIGLNTPAPTGLGPMDGKVAQVTTAGLAGPFGYLKGSFTFDNLDASLETDGYIATPIAPPPPGESVESLVTSEGGTILGIHRNAVRENMFLTFSGYSAQTHMRLLGPGIIEWLSNGTHLGLVRNYLGVHIDDVFDGDARWNVTSNCTPGEDCPSDTATPEIRMTAADVGILTGWQSRTGLKLDMVYNGNAAVWRDGASLTGTDPAADSLSAALIEAKAQLRWINHTYQHLYLGCVQEAVPPWNCATPLTYVPLATINSDIASNLTFANAYALPIDPTELVSGEHSGLKDTNPGRVQDDNLHFITALGQNGIKVTASDWSKEKDPRPLGSAVTLPRYPNNIYYNVATKAESADEFNWIYTSVANGGSGICEANPQVTTCIAPVSTDTGFESSIAPFEARQTLLRVLNNDPRPHYSHQSNLAEDGLTYIWLDRMLTTYEAAVAGNTPIVQPTMTEAALVLQQQASWKAGMGNVSAYIKGGQVVVSNNGSGSVWVPLSAATGTLPGTTTPFADAYMGSRSKWTQLASGASLTIDIAPNVLPTAAFTADCTADPACTFTSTSSDTDGTVQTYAWDFGDGSTSTTGPVVSHTFTSRGTFTVTLTVTDNRAGASASPATTQVTISKVNGKPTAAFTVNCTDLVCTVDGSGSADPEADPITTWEWTFGDGSSPATGATPPAHTFPGGGTFTITLTVTDSLGAVSDPISKSVTVSPARVNKAPTAAFTPTCVDLTCGFNASASSDTDGSLVSYQWTFGDGTGAAGVNPLGHVFPGAGTYAVTLTVFDNEGAAGSTIQNVTVAAAPTVAAPGPPSPTIKAKAVSGKGKLKVDINPNLKGKKYWRFQVQKLDANGTWRAPGKVYKTTGKKEIKTINFKKGTYRVFVSTAQNGYGIGYSVPVVLKK